MENIFDIPVSYYKSISDNQGVAATLHTLLTKPRPEHLIILEKVRAAVTREEKNRLKKSLLPLFTTSAHLVNRIATVPLSEKLISYTGFIQFDIDSKENPGMNACQLRDAIARIPFVAYASLSASGRGVWGLVRIECPQQMDKHYQHFKEVVEGKSGIKLDTTKGSNATDLRYISFDPDARINYNAVPLPLPPPKKTKPKPVFRPTVARPFTSQGYGHGDSTADVELLVNEAVARGMNLLDDYQKYFAAGSGIARELGERGRSMFHAVSQFDIKYNERETDVDYSRWAKNPKPEARIGAFFNICKERGLLIKDLKAYQRSKQPYKPAARPTLPAEPEATKHQYDLIQNDEPENQYFEPEAALCQHPPDFQVFIQNDENPGLRSKHQYDPAAIAGLIASPHYFTSIEAVDEIAAKVPEPFWYDALLDYNTAMQTPAPQEAARAYLRVFHKLRS